MISSFEVGAIFRIVNEASPALRTILRQIRELHAAVDKAKANIATIAKMPGLAVATAEVKALAVEWREVAKAAAAANRSIGAASRRSLAGPGAAAVAETQSIAAAWERIAAASIAVRGGRAALPPPPGVPGGPGRGGGGRARLGNRIGMGGSGAGVYVGGPGVAIPGGGHINTHGGALAAAGLVGYAGYEAAQMEDSVFQLIYHSGLENNDANKTRFRKILQDAMKQTGFGLHDISESAKQEIRMFQGTPGGGLDVLPEMLKAAAIEARLKGESPEESMKALIGLAHMTKQYAPEDIKKLAPAFAFLSTANPGSLSSIERAAGYAVPLLQSGLEIDPMQSLLLGTALTRAGATSTKSGTWLREMALRAMPGTAGLMSESAFKRHEEALKAFGLSDAQGKPTWFTNGKPDIFKMLNIAGDHAASIPIEKRAAYERSLFGAQGGGGFALLADPAVHAQIQSLSKEMNSPEFKNRYGSFMESYNSQVTAQNARTAMQTFNVTMQDLGATVLPSVNQALKNTKSILESITGILPGAKDDGKIGGAAITGALGGAASGFVIGRFGGPVGALSGALGGAAIGALSAMPNSGIDKGGSFTSPGKTGKPAQPKVEVNLPQQNVTLNIDGETLAQVILNKIGGMFGHETSAPASDGSMAYGP